MLAVGRHGDCPIAVPFDIRSVVSVLSDPSYDDIAEAKRIIVVHGIPVNVGVKIPALRILAVHIRS
jgi:hypothetical protein